MTTYNLNIENEDGDTLADASGSLKVVKTAYDEAKVTEQAGDVTVTLIETDGFGGPQKGDKAIISLTADPETVSDVAARRFSALRKTDPDVPPRRPRGSRTATAETGAAETTPETETAPEVTQY
jgi:hypothetical protein